MAVGAAFRNRRVFPKVGPALFRMAGEAGVVQCLAHELPVRRLTVRAVATTAIHFSLLDRMRVRFKGLAALLLVAIETNVRLGRGKHHRVFCRVDGMAVGAGHVVVVMAAAVPAEPGICLVAVHAESVLLRDRRCSIRSEIYGRRSFLATSHASGVIARRTMAGLALQLSMAKRTARVARYGVLRPKDGKCRLVVMTGKTGVRTLATVRNRLRGVLGSLRGNDRRCGKAQQQQRKERVLPEPADCYCHVVFNGQG